MLVRPGKKQIKASVYTSLEVQLCVPRVVPSRRTQDGPKVSSDEPLLMGCVGGQLDPPRWTSLTPLSPWDELRNLCPILLL